MDLEYSCAYLCMYLFLCMYPFFHAYEPEWCFLLDYKGLVFTQFKCHQTRVNNYCVLCN